MGETTRNALPYPEGSDNVDVPADLQALADRLDLLLPGSIVDTLPSSPVDGQTVHFQTAAMASVGRVWPLRYRAGSGSSYKWEALGAVSPLSAAVADTGVIGGATWGDTTGTTGPSVTAPLPGDYEIAVEGQGYVEDGGQIWMGFEQTGVVSANDAYSSVLSAFVIGDGDNAVNAPLRYSGEFTIATALTVVKAKYRSEILLSGTVSKRRITLRPIRVAAAA